jgi:hypothetical protein
MTVASRRRASDAYGLQIGWLRAGISMDEYKQIESFDIDHGELDGLSLQEAFCLGYEFAVVMSLLKNKGPSQQLVHANNHERIEKLCRASGRTYRLEWTPDDVSETWMKLTVDHV